MTLMFGLILISGLIAGAVWWRVYELSEPEVSPGGPAPTVIDDWRTGYVDGQADGDAGLPHQVVPMNYPERPGDMAYWSGYSAGWIEMFDRRKS